MPHGINIATFRDDGEIEEVFTSTTVRTRDTVFHEFGGAGMRAATEAEPPRVRRRGRSQKNQTGQRLLLQRPVVESEVRDENGAPAEEVHDGGRMQDLPQQQGDGNDRGQIQKSYDDELRRPALPHPQRARR